MSDNDDYDTVLQSLGEHLGDERVRLSKTRDVVTEASLALTDSVGKVHVRVATMTFHLVERLDLKRMLEDPAFWQDNIRGWEMLGLDYQPLDYSPVMAWELAAYPHVRQSLLPTYLTEWMKALQSEKPGLRL